MKDGSGDNVPLVIMIECVSCFSISCTDTPGLKHQKLRIRPPAPTAVDADASGAAPQPLDLLDFFFFGASFSLMCTL